MENRYDDIMAKLGWYYLPQHVDVTEEHVKELELRIACQLPEDYRHFLRKYSVATHKMVATFPSLSNPSKVGGGVDVFFGFAKDSSYDLFENWQGMEDRIPRGYLAIADSPGGLICIGLEGTDRGKVFWWDRAENHDTPEQNMYLVGHSFDEFIKNLIPYEYGKGQ
jgi:hypothetical protein